jgi:diguanylate cyclase (GGDEF)-like protein
LDIGQADDDVNERRRRKVLQYCGLLGVGSMFAYAAVYALAGWRELISPIALSLACIPLYILIMVLNRQGRVLAAKLLLCGGLGASIFASTWFLIGRTPGMHFFFLLAAMVPLLLFRLREWPWIAALTLLDALGFLVVHFRDDESGILVPAFPEAWLHFYNAMSLVAVYFTTILILVYLQRRADEDARAISRKASEMEDLMRQYEELAKHDSLTGLLNRRAMHLCMHEETIRMNRGHPAFSLIMFDIDFFKTVNDRHGHQAGDLVLQAVADCVRGGLREIDQVARWGGEEFLVLLPDTGLQGAAVVAEKLRLLVMGLALPFGGDELRCTVTLGLAEHGLAGENPEDTVRMADAALYTGKAAGRNRVSLPS